MSLVGTTLAQRYKIQGFIGERRMGQVYAAMPLQGAQQRVSVKLLHQHLLGDDRVVRRFKQEFEITSRLRHPNVVRALEFGESEGDYYVVSEFHIGHMLDEVLFGAAMDVDRAVAIAAQIADALGAAHQEQTVHRDVSPSNIMLVNVNGHPDIVKVYDFGLARLEHGDRGDDEDDEWGERVTAVGVRIGTPQYMAPEYIADDKLDARSDIYALGITLYELLTGAPPFDGDDPYEVLDAHVEKTAQPPSAFNAKVPKWLDKLVLRMLAKKPDDRPQSAEEVIEALEAGAGKPLRVTDESLAVPPVVAAPTVSRAASPLNNQLLLALILAGATLLAAGVGIGLALAQMM